MKTLSNVIFILEQTMLLLFSKCDFSLDDVNLESGLGSGHCDYSALFEIDSASAIVPSLQFIDHRPDNMSLIANISYENVLQIDQYNCIYCKIGEEDSLVMTIDIIVDHETVDCWHLVNKNLKYHDCLDLDTAHIYMVYHKLLIDCAKNPQFSERSYQRWYEHQNYAVIYFSS